MIYKIFQAINEKLFLVRYSCVIYEEDNEMSFFGKCNNVVLIVETGN